MNRAKKKHSSLYPLFPIDLEGGFYLSTMINSILFINFNA